MPKSSAVLIVPTGNPRHITAIREGKISAEAWSRKRLAALPVDPDVMTTTTEADLSILKNFEGGRKAILHASEVEEDAKVGVRRKRRSMGKTPPFQQDEKEAVKRAKQRKAQKPKVKNHRDKPAGENT